MRVLHFSYSIRKCLKKVDSKKLVKGEPKCHIFAQVKYILKIHNPLLTGNYHFGILANL